MNIKLSLLLTMRMQPLAQTISGTLLDESNKKTRSLTPFAGPCRVRQVWRMITQKIIIILFIIAASGSRVFAQVKFANNPDSAEFDISNIKRFWDAFDQFKKDSTTNSFVDYVSNGGKGIRGFMEGRIVSAENLFDSVKIKKAAYEKVRLTTLQISESPGQCRSAYYALKYLYPEAKFPTCYFVIGTFNSGGTSNDLGIFIGAETQRHPERVPCIVAHELIHYQQNIPPRASLPEESIVEGSADFVGELISGGNINKEKYRYGDAHADQLCREFVTRMNGADYMDWLYGTSKKDDRPHDMGYWIGYQISKQYYLKAANKRQAISDILKITHYHAFLKKSGYLEKYLQ